LELYTAFTVVAAVDQPELWGRSRVSWFQTQDLHRLMTSRSFLTVGNQAWKTD
jgi:hypothetical protein